METKQKKVLVTGASGYVALHCVQQLLSVGYTVRGTVRSLTNKDKVDPLRALPGASERLELVKADLVEDVDKWPSVIEGCSYIFHVASPWPIVADESTIKVAVDGTLNVLKAATKTHMPVEKTDTKMMSEYSMKFVGPIWRVKKSIIMPNPKQTHRFQLTVINPTFITGPVLSTAPHGSATILARIMDFKKYLGSPKACLGLVDVRDVARAHVRALETPESNGQRILITHRQPVWFADMAHWLREEFESEGYLISPIVCPNWLTKLFAKVSGDKEAGAIIHRLGPELHFSNLKSIDLLNMTYIDPKNSVLDMVYSMIEKKMIVDPPLRRLKRSKKTEKNPENSSGNQNLPAA